MASDCDNCVWKKRDPKKLDKIITQFDNTIKRQKELILTLQVQLKELNEKFVDVQYEARGGGQRRLPVDPATAEEYCDDIPF